MRLGSLMGGPNACYIINSEGYYPHQPIHNVFDLNLTPLGPCSDHVVLIDEIVNGHVFPSTT